LARFLLALPASNGTYLLQVHFPPHKDEMEKAMRSFVAYGIGALSAVAIGAAVAMGVNANNESEIAEQTEVAAIEADNNAKVASANARAQSAEAKARAAEAAAEAKIRCEKERQEASNRGAVVGGVTGAVIGSQVAGDGAKSEGGVIGGAVGVLTGRQIAKKDHRC
jgi:uncharacterized protein YcfJ